MHANETNKFAQHLADNVRKSVLNDIDPAQLMCCDDAFVVVRSTGSLEIRPITKNIHGASYTTYVLRVRLELCLFNHTGSIEVLLAGTNLNGLQAIQHAAYTLESIDGAFTLPSSSGEDLIVDIHEMAEDQCCEVKDIIDGMLVSGTIVEKRLLCGRCDGTGHERGSSDVCKLCEGDGWEIQRRIEEMYEE